MAFKAPVSLGSLTGTDFFALRLGERAVDGFELVKLKFGHRGKLIKRLQIIIFHQREQTNLQ